MKTFAAMLNYYQPEDSSAVGWFQAQTPMWEQRIADAIKSGVYAVALGSWDRSVASYLPYCEKQLQSLGYRTHLININYKYYDIIVVLQ